MIQLPVKALCARLKALLKLFVQEMSSFDEHPAIAVSKDCASTEEQWETSYTPIKYFISLTFLGTAHEERVEMLWGLARSFP